MLRFSSLVKITCVALIFNCCYSDHQSPLILVFDQSTTKRYKDVPKHYRNAKRLNWLPYNVSGSAQPNVQNLRYIITQAKKHIAPQNIFIIDLRQEPHAFLNQQPVSWYGFRNQVPNSLEPQLIAQLGTLTNVIVYHGIEKLADGYFLPKDYSSITVNSISTEQQLVTSLQAQYSRILVIDHYAPEPYQVDSFIKFIKNLPQEHWLHFHCRGGRGRTTTFMALYDIIQHASQLSLDSILTRQKKLGGIDLLHYNMPEPKKQWKQPAAQKRSIFIKQFYNYVLDTAGYKQTLWSEWIQQTK